MERGTQAVNDAAALDDIIVSLGSPEGTSARSRLVSSDHLAALGRAGTSHVYADTADADELKRLLAPGDGTLIEEVDGSTANQPLVRKVARHYLEAGDPPAWARELRERRADLSPTALIPLLYTVILGRVGNDAARGFASGRSWEVSLQIHMGLAKDPEAMLRTGRAIRRMVPSGIVKIPFTPHAPHCFLVARDLERAGIPVNFTSTFSARQVVAVALLADVSRTNVFMGRLNQGLEAELLGEHVDLEAQRAVIQLRREVGIKTQLIVASMREWQTFQRTAGCDVYTAPCDAIRAFIEQTEVPPAEITSQLETSYADRLGIAPEVVDKVGMEAIARLYRVEPDLVAFLREFRATAEYRDMRDGERLERRLESAGFADLFYAPTAKEWSAIRKNKLPDFDSPLAKELPLDTLYTLLAHGDFENHQEAIDGEIRRAAGL